VGARTAAPGERPRDRLQVGRGEEKAPTYGVRAAVALRGDAW
jgi:hypothetical protein